MRGIYSARVVAQITEGTAFDKHGRPFRRRNSVPAAVLFAVLAVATLIAWLVVANQPAEIHQAITCNPPPAPTEANQPKLGDEVSQSSMVNVVPAKLADTKIKVLNASGQGGQASEVAGELRDLGFGQPAASNDPVYASTRMECQGQIRFGPAGKSAAAALWKRVVISLASATFASLGFAPCAIACFSDSMCAIDLNDSSVYQRHISTSEMDSTLANMVLASSLMPM